ncbi:MAG TPA: FMN-binding protein [Microbacterium sp.]|uniref:FMN-binding protein n=1 Tax=Microbacterium sp. TaxID=51671 RepID=UPI002B489089|nr:FMN-binding protein [Microbacterium sp.]HKT56310.1 FMN-binding protein [Microbacterium sp.]
MKKIVIAILATVSGLVLLFSYRTSLDQSIPTAATTPAGGATASTGGTPASTPSASGPSSSASTPKPTAKPKSGLKDGTYTGQAVDTQYGPVEVQITVSGGKITSASAPQYPQGSPRDQEINAQAIPMLVAETTQASSSNIDMISGATYTSEGYIQSLQSALDQAK